MSEGRAILAGALLGALVGGVATYLFMTEGGRGLRDRFEPKVDDLRHEFSRFQRTLQKVSDMAQEGLRVVQEFNAARGETFEPRGTSH